MVKFDRREYGSKGNRCPILVGGSKGEGGGRQSHGNRRLCSGEVTKTKSTFSVRSSNVTQGRNL